MACAFKEFRGVMTLKAIILAAGAGRRLKEITQDPKCMLKVAGETLIKRQLLLIERVHCHPVIVVGYRYKSIIKHIGHKEMVMNPIWKRTNTLVSLLFAISGAPDDCLVINGDVIFRDDLLEKLLSANYSACATQCVDEPTDEEVKVKCKGSVVFEIGKQVVDSNLEAVGVYLFRKPLVRDIRDHAYMVREPWGMYYEDIVDKYLEFHPMETVDTTEAVEIDTPEDYRRAKKIYE